MDILESALNQFIDARLRALGLLKNDSTTRVSTTAAVVAAPATGKGGKPGKPAKPPVTLDSLRSDLKKVMEASGKDEVVACLARVGVAKLGDVTEDQYAELNDVVQRSLKGESAVESTGTVDDDLFGDDD